MTRPRSTTCFWLVVTLAVLLAVLAPLAERAQIQGRRLFDCLVYILLLVVAQSCYPPLRLALSTYVKSLAQRREVGRRLLAGYFALPLPCSYPI